MSVTMKNLESAFAGESMAFMKYSYFAKLAREAGFDEVAEHFEWTADQEFKHAQAHVELLLGTPSVKESLEMAIAGETYEYSEMYPQFESIALREGQNLAAQEAREQAHESKQHAEAFAEILKKAEKRFAALAKIERRHAEAYQQVLETL